MMHCVEFRPGGEVGHVSAGDTLLNAARAAGVQIEAPCAGVGTCGKCRVRLVSGSVEEEPGRHRLGAAERAAGWVLACTARVTGDLVVEVGDAAPPLRIVSHGLGSDLPLAPAIRKTFSPERGETEVRAGDRLLGVETGDTTARLYGLAVDIGTTTLVVSLVDLATGEEKGSAAALNPQARRAQDVLSRIRLAQEPAGLEELQREVIAALNALNAEAAEKAGVDRRSTYEAVLSGNTCMLHLACGVSPASLGRHPYTPALTGGCHLPAAQIGLEIAPFGLVYLPPVISAWVGADITAGIQATGLHREERTTLLVDIGTNGEMVLAHGDRLYAASTAAGPAFEGMNIACGMRAAPGAIERFSLAEDGTVHLQVIGGGEPAGICGSGLLDLVAELVRAGVIAPDGGFRRDLSGLAAPLRERLEQREGKPVFRLGERVFLSRGDIRQVQLAKGAIRAGIELLLQHADIDASAVGQVLIAGAFGYHLRPESLLTLGLLPAEFAGRIAFVGNTAKTGSQAFLLNAPCRAEMERLVGEVEVVELAVHSGFERLFVRCLGF